MLSLPTILADHVQFHSAWQIETAIVGRSGTAYGCYKQAVRELYQRCLSIRGHVKALELLEVDCDELAGLIARNGGRSPAMTVQSHQVRRWQIELQDKQIQRADILAVLQEVQAEFLRFLGQAIAYRRELGVSDGEAISPELQDSLDRDMWLHNVRAMCAMDFLTNRALQRSTLDLVRALPKHQKQVVVGEISTPEAQESLINWFLNWDCPELPPVKFEADELARILECTSTISLLPSHNGLPVKGPCQVVQPLPTDWRPVSNADGVMALTAR